MRQARSSITPRRYGRRPRATDRPRERTGTGNTGGWRPGLLLKEEAALSGASCPHEAVVVSGDDGLDAVAQAQFAQHCGDMVFDGGFRQTQALGDLRVR